MRNDKLNNKTSQKIPNIGVYTGAAHKIQNKKADWAKCQPSVKNTKKVVEPKNLDPSFGSRFLYLFLQLRSGFQNFGFKRLKILLLYLN